MVPKEDVAQILGLYGTVTSCVLMLKKQQAKKKGVSFNLSWDALHDLLGQPCVYCGDAPANTYKVWDEGTCFPLRYQGIDRVDNLRGYEPDNVVPCCKRCNAAKNDGTLEDFLARARRIAERAQ